MLVVDRPGSMLLGGKLDAAKNAARLYTDATADGNINLAEGNWPGIEGDVASDRTIPNFSSSAPVTN